MYKVVNLRCDKLNVYEPTFSWCIKSDIKGVKQYRFELQVALNEAFKTVIWQCNRMTQQTTGIKYTGPKLESGTEYHIRVRSWKTESEVSKWSNYICFVTPFLLKERDWVANWIFPSVNCRLPNTEYKEKRTYIAQKTFTLKDLPKTARLYITSLGICKQLATKVESFVRTNVRTGVFTQPLLRKALSLPAYFCVKAQCARHF